MRKEYTSEQRSELLDLVTGGRATVVEAAAQLGVTASTAYNWVQRAAIGAARRARAGRPGRSRGRRSPNRPTFVRLIRAEDVAATIEVRIGGAEILVRRGFDVEVLRAVVVALRGGAG